MVSYKGCNYLYCLLALHQTKHRFRHGFVHFNAARNRIPGVRNRMQRSRGPNAVGDNFATSIYNSRQPISPDRSKVWPMRALTVTTNGLPCSGGEGRCVWSFSAVDDRRWPLREECSALWNFQHDRHDGNDTISNVIAPAAVIIYSDDGPVLPVAIHS